MVVVVPQVLYFTEKLRIILLNHNCARHGYKSVTPLSRFCEKNTKKNDWSPNQRKRKYFYLLTKYIEPQCFFIDLINAILFHMKQVLFCPNNLVTLALGSPVSPANSRSCSICSTQVGSIKGSHGSTANFHYR